MRLDVADVARGLASRRGPLTRDWWSALPSEPRGTVALRHLRQADPNTTPRKGHSRPICRKCLSRVREHNKASDPLSYYSLPGFSQCPRAQATFATFGSPAGNGLKMVESGFRVGLAPATRRRTASNGIRTALNHSSGWSRIGLSSRGRVVGATRTPLQSTSSPPPADQLPTGFSQRPRARAAMATFEWPRGKPLKSLWGRYERYCHCGAA